MVTKASGEFLGHTICTDRTPGFSKTAKSTAESRWMPISMLSLSRNLAHGSIAANAFGSAPPPDVSLITYEDVLGRGRRNCPFSQATAPPWSSAPCGRYLRIRGGWNRRLADKADRVRGRDNWAGSRNRPNVWFRRRSGRSRVVVTSRWCGHRARDVHWYRGSLQLFPAANSAATRSLPQILLPARRGCSRK